MIINYIYQMSLILLTHTCVGPCFQLFDLYSQMTWSVYNIRFLFCSNFHIVFIFIYREYGWYVQISRHQVSFLSSNSPSSISVPVSSHRKKKKKHKFHFSADGYSVLFHLFIKSDLHLPW